jgi:hypothetical protein
MPEHRSARTRPFVSEERKAAGAWMCRLGGPDPAPYPRTLLRPKGSEKTQKGHEINDHLF